MKMFRNNHTLCNLLLLLLHSVNFCTSLAASSTSLGASGTEVGTFVVNLEIWSQVGPEGNQLQFVAAAAAAAATEITDWSDFTMVAVADNSKLNRAADAAVVVVDLKKGIVLLLCLTVICTFVPAPWFTGEGVRTKGAEKESREGKEEMTHKHTYTHTHTHIHSRCSKKKGKE